MGAAKKKELQQLANQREDLRIQEARLKKEVEAMESKLYSQEQIFKQMSQNAQGQSEDVKNATMKKIKDQEKQFIFDHVQHVARIKADKDKLEGERKRIMN